MSRTRSITARGTFVALCIAASACSDSSAPAPAPQATSLSIVSGSDQRGTVGAPLPNPIKVRVVDASGHAFAGANVVFSVSSGHGYADPIAVRSDDSGYAATTWTLGTNAAESQTLDATLSGKAPVSVHATSVADVAAALTIGRLPSRASVAQTMSDPPLVSVVDQFGNAVRTPGLPVQVSFTGSAAGRDFIGATQVSTDSSGSALFRDLAIIGQLGTVSIGFTSGTLRGVQGSIQLSAGAATSIELVGARVQSGSVGTAGPALSVRARDSGGNPVGGTTVTFTNSLTKIAATRTTDTLGIATFDGWNYPDQTTSFEIVATTFAGGSATFSLATRAGTPAVMTVVGDTSFAGGAGDRATPLSVLLKDARGNPASGFVVTFTVDDGDLTKIGGVSAPSVDVLTDSAGVAKLQWKNPGAIGRHTVKARTAGLADVITFSGDIVIGQPRYAFQTGATPFTQAGGQVELTGRLTDAGFNGSANAVARVSYDPGASGPSLIVTQNDGSFHFSYTVHQGQNSIHISTASGATGDLIAYGSASVATHISPAYAIVTAGPGAVFLLRLQGVDAAGIPAPLPGPPTRITSDEPGHSVTQLAWDTFLIKVGSLGASGIAFLDFSYNDRFGFTLIVQAPGASP